jgi:hypothetical protein
MGNVFLHTSYSACGIIAAVQLKRKEAYMTAVVFLFIHILVFALVFTLLYYAGMATVGVMPPPGRPLARAGLVALLCLIAVLLLLGEVGVLGTVPWGYSTHRGW